MRPVRGVRAHDHRGTATPAAESARLAPDTRRFRGRPSRDGPRPRRIRARPRPARPSRGNRHMERGRSAPRRTRLRARRAPRPRRRDGTLSGGVRHELGCRRGRGAARRHPVARPGRSGRAVVRHVVGVSGARASAPCPDPHRRRRDARAAPQVEVGRWAARRTKSAFQGSRQTARRPTSGTSSGPIWMLPPFSVTFATAASQSSAPKTGCQ